MPYAASIATYQTPREQQKFATNLDDALRFISASSNLFHNGDTLAQEAAIDALQAGRETYWSKAGYSNQRASRFLTVANRSGLAYAISAVADDTSATHAGRTPYLLGSLIPLNHSAMLALEGAWAEA